MYHDWDWEAADRAFRRAAELNPSLAETHAHFAWLYVLKGEWSQAIAEAKMAQELDPLGPAFTSWLTEVYLGAGRYDDALVENEKAFELYPGWDRAHFDRGWALVGKGLFDEAFVEFQVAAETSPRWKAHYGRALIMGGRTDEAGRVLEELNADRAEVPPPAMASLRALQGDLDGAMETLEHGYETRDPAMPWIGAWYDFGDLVDDPRFLALLDRMNLELIAKPAG